MSDQAPGSGEGKYASPTISRKRKSRISWIWLVPVVAALMGLSLVVRTWMQAGPDLSIEFNTAEGLEVGKTQLRYKDVNVGTVRSIGFNADRSKVVVQAELSKDVADLAREGTNFWVVRPRLDVSGVSGLGTLLSGAYIGVDAVEGKDSSKKATKLHFVGLETPPAVTHDRAGKRFKLKAADLGSLDIGSPVYFRRINVGRVIGYELDKTGNAVNVEVFVDAPNDKFVTNGTRFWNASGVDFSVNAEGLKVRTQSLVSMAVGGVAFEPVYSARDANTPAAADTHFELYATEAAAKANPTAKPSRSACALISRSAVWRWARRSTSRASRWATSPRSTWISIPSASASSRWWTPRCIRNAWAGSTTRCASTPSRTATRPADACWAS